MTFKILSLDGGGMRGVISAQILKQIEKTVWEKHGQKLHEYFDLIAGTSTGSILAAGIACGMSAKQLIKFYEDEGENIFLKGVRWQRSWRKVPQFFGDIPFLKNIPILGNNPLYPHKKGKDQGLANVLEEKLKLRNNKGEVVNDSPTMADIEKTQLLIPAYDVKSRNTTWFANDDSTEWWYKNNNKLWQICTASASAPTFFPPYRLNGLPHIDGGVSANNPTAAAIAHALSMGQKIDEITVLSIGTGQTTHPYTFEQIKNWGLKDWALNIPDIFLDPSAENSEHISKRIFLGSMPKNYLRLNFKLENYIKVEKKPIHRKIYEPVLGRIENIDIYKFRTEENTDYIEDNKQLKTVGDIDNKKVKTEEDIDIDNPDICDDLIDAAKKYIELGEVYYDKKENTDEMRKILVKDAIDKFFYNVKKQDDKKHLAGV